MTILLIVALLGMAARLVDLQVSQGTQLAAAAVAQQEQSVAIPAARGLILDDDGQVLSGNSVAYDIFADPEEIPVQSRLHEATELSPFLGIATSDLDATFSKALQFVYLAKNQTPAVEAKLAAWTWPGSEACPSR